MKLELEVPIKEIHGTIDPESDVYYRVLNGVQIVQHKPQVTSEKQKAWRKIFAERYKGKH